MAEIIKNNTEYFKNFREMLHDLFNLKEKEIVSDMRTASYDDENDFYLYSNEDKLLNMEVVKLDDMTEQFFHYMQKERKLKEFMQPQAVDAVCINNKNDWFFIEFKNREYDKNVISDVKKKIFKSLWFVSSMNSFAGTNLFADIDFADFARRHITYIIVISRKQNPDEYRRIHESYNNLYTPDNFKKYIGYYLKDVYLFTEQELYKFIKNFNR